MVWTLWQRECREWERREGRREGRQDDWVVRGHITSHGGPGSKDQVSDVYQQSIHGGSLVPLTITPQHLAIPTQETWGHFLPFREFRHTPAASHAPPQPIEECTDYQGERHRDTTDSKEHLNYEKIYIWNFGLSHILTDIVHRNASQRCVPDRFC